MLIIDVLECSLMFLDILRLSLMFLDFQIGKRQNREVSDGLRSHSTACGWVLSVGTALPLKPPPLLVMLMLLLSESPSHAEMGRRIYILLYCGGICVVFLIVVIKFAWFLIYFI